MLVDNSSRHFSPNQLLCHCLVTDVLLLTTSAINRYYYDWCWLILIDTAWCWLISIDSDWYKFHLKKCGKLCKICKVLNKYSQLCKVVQNFHNFVKSANCAKCGYMCKMSKVLNKLCKMCKIKPNIHNCS